MKIYENPMFFRQHQVFSGSFSEVNTSAGIHRIENPWQKRNSLSKSFGHDLVLKQKMKPHGDFGGYPTFEETQKFVLPYIKI